MNQDLFLWFNNLVGQSVVFDTIAFFSARDLIFILVAGYLGFVFRESAKGRPRLVVATILCSLLAFQLIILIHAVYPTPRPQATDLPVKVLIEYVNNYSFPSRHTVFAFLLATVVFSCLCRRGFRARLVGIAYLTGATIIGLSRIVVGVHFPADVLAGAVIGIGFGYLATLLLD